MTRGWWRSISSKGVAVGRTHEREARPAQGHRRQECRDVVVLRDHDRRLARIAFGRRPALVDVHSAHRRTGEDSLGRHAAGARSKRMRVPPEESARFCRMKACAGIAVSVTVRSRAMQSAPACVVPCKEQGPLAYLGQRCARRRLERRSSAKGPGVSTPGPFCVCAMRSAHDERADDDHEAGERDESGATHGCGGSSTPACRHGSAGRALDHAAVPVTHPRFSSSSTAAAPPVRPPPGREPCAGRRNWG